jgi:methyltransferase (TIGR00027 family)
VFLPGFARVILNVPILRRYFMSRMAPAGIYEYVIARTKLFDDAFVDALESGFPQAVILGAGMDTRALRFADKNTSTRVFELDLPRTQEPKREILARKRVPLPEQLTFTPIDFNKQSLSEVLTAAGYVADQRTLFLWEGVVMYLTPDAVNGTLAFIRDSSAEGSRVVFDYVHASVLRQEHRYYGEAAIFATVSRAGEGWTFGIEEGGIEGFLSERGFGLVSHYTSSDLEREYLTSADGTLFGRINGTHAIAVASVS